nr:MAG TPA: hypothetical protein [Caudoviricetes sp.]
MLLLITTSLLSSKILMEIGYFLMVLTMLGLLFIIIIYT